MGVQVKTFQKTKLIGREISAVAVKYRKHKFVSKKHQTTLLLVVLMVMTICFLLWQQEQDLTASIINHVSIIPETSFSTWSRVSDRIYTYSAFLDTRPQNKHSIPIRVIGLLKLPPKGQILQTAPLQWYRIKDEQIMNPLNFHCKLFYVDDVTGVFTYITAEKLTHRIYEEGLEVYAGTFFNCYFNTTVARMLKESSNPISVAIYPTSSAVDIYPTKLIPVDLIPVIQNMNSGFNVSAKEFEGITLCVRPLFGPMNDLVQLRQFLAFYRAMGIAHFNFYDFGLSPRVREYLRKKSFRTGRIILRKWNLPTGNWAELWDYGSLSALNDCVYRNMEKRWVILVDLDEFMVPQSQIANETLRKLLFDFKFTNYSQLLVKNTFFCKEFCPDENGKTKEGSSRISMERSNKFPIFSCLTRTKRVWNVNLRSKFIVNPQHILQVGHHYVTQFLDFSGTNVQNQLPMIRFHHFKSYTFPEQILILNHYRECTSISTKKQPILGRLTMTDATILKYKQQILNAMND